MEEVVALGVKIPYLYARTTPDGRLMVGGEDDAIDVPARRDRRLKKKAVKLQTKLQDLFPKPLPETAFSWAGTFTERRSAILWSPSKNWRPPHYAMAYGGNGIVYSILGAELIRALIERRSHSLQTEFWFQRYLSS